MTPRVAGPSRLQMLRSLPAIHRSLPDYLLALHRRYGDTVSLPLVPRSWLLVDPDDIRHVLVTNARGYHKGGGLRAARELLGRGLVSSEPPLHTRQRKLMAPMFHRRAIAGFADLMRDATEARVATWRDGDVIDVSAEMMTLTLAIVGQALFSVDLDTTAGDIGRTFTRAQWLITRRQRQVPIPSWVPTPANLRYRRDITSIDAFVQGLINERRQAASQPEDLLGLLLAARDEDGTPMAPNLLRDEVTTLMIAGHETVANHLAWTFHALAGRTDVQQRLVDEWTQVLCDRPITLDHVPGLSLTENVLAESLRFLPPAWTLARRAIEDDTLPSGVRIGKGHEVLMSQYVSQRSPRNFTEPDRFDPDRWNQELRRQVPATGYYPFGVGPRYCIGEPFARMEATIMLATIGRRVSLAPVDDAPVRKDALIVMRPRGGLRMRVSRR